MWMWSEAQKQKFFFSEEFVNFGATLMVITLGHFFFYFLNSAHISSPQIYFICLLKY